MIRINGHLGATVLSAFPALAPRRHGAHTVLTGPYRSLATSYLFSAAVESAEASPVAWHRSA